MFINIPTSRVTKLPNKTESKHRQAKFRKSEGLMGNISCLFHGLRKAGICKDKVRESRSPTLDTNTSADSGIHEPDPNEIQENNFLDNFISAVRYLNFYYIAI